VSDADAGGSKRSPPLADRVRNRARVAAKRLELRTRRRLSGQEVLWIDYGWAQLPFTDDGDEQELLYHLNQRRWRKKELAVLAPVVPLGATVFDIGANLGFYSSLFAAQTGPTGYVLAFEPSSHVFRKLRATIERNRLSHVTALNVGCGSASGETVLRQVSRSSGNATLVGGTGAGERVQIRRLDDIPEAVRRRPHLLKIDVEGFESEVLAGARSILERDRPVLYIELCGDYARSTMESLAILDEVGYDTRLLRELNWAEIPNGSNFLIAAPDGAH
jgi:FkbM family methyltransferase